MGVDATCAALSRPFPSEMTRQAASEVLSDPDGWLDRTYHFLVWQRTLRTALGHLSDAGGDMERLAVTAERFRTTFPRKLRPIWDVDVSHAVTAAQILEVYATHKRLLAETVTVLATAGVERYALLSGRAYQARYEEYGTRVEFDTDLLAPDVDSAIETSMALENAGFAFDTLRIRRLGSAADATVEIRRQVEGHRVSVGILVGGYHDYRAPIYERSELIDFLGRRVRAPLPEDMLVMLAARVERKRAFALVNVNDAAVILARDGATLDWDHVVTSARAARLGATLRVILWHAEEVLQRSVVPEAAHTALAATSALPYRLGRQTADAHMRPSGTSRSDRMAERAWRLDLRRRAALREDTPTVWSRTVRHLQRSILKRQMGSGGGGMGGRTASRVATRARTRVGALCEVAPHLAGGEGCLGRLGRWKGSAEAQALLTVCAEGIQPPAGPHRCTCMLFDLSERHGT
jgi:hypothetical protein